MSNSGQFITIQRAKEKNKTEHHHLSTSVTSGENKREREKRFTIRETPFYITC